MTERPASAPGDALLVVLIPVFNDWPAADATVQRVDGALSASQLSAEFLLVDDGSTEPPGELGGSAALRRRCRVLQLLRNVGHQRAIAIGLAWLAEHVGPRAVVIMDGDGEDDPADVPRLLARWSAEGGGKVVFAERRRRSESWLFRVFYEVYCGLHYVLTGLRVRVGNFSVVPGTIVRRLVVCDELWNHYAAAVVKTRQPWTSVPTARAARIAGRSQMNFVSLVAHGLSAMSVYSETIGARVLTVTLALVALVGIAALGQLAARLLGWPWPAWMAFSLGGAALALAQVVTFGLVFVFVVLKGRQGSAFIPIRDYRPFVGSVRRVGADD